MNKRFAVPGWTRDPDELHGDTVVAEITIQLRRNGAMGVGGTITDEPFAQYMLDTAKDVLRTYHAKRELGLRGELIVPAYDTALVGTPEEKQLLAARDELANAMNGA